MDTYSLGKYGCHYRMEPRRWQMRFFSLVFKLVEQNVSATTSLCWHFKFLWIKHEADRVESCSAVPEPPLNPSAANLMDVNSACNQASGQLIVITLLDWTSFLGWRQPAPPMGSGILNDPQHRPSDATWLDAKSRKTTWLESERKNGWFLADFVCIWWQPGPWWSDVFH